MHHFALTRADNMVLSAVLAEIADAYDTIENRDLIRRAPVFAKQLPAHFLEFLEEFRIGEPSALCLVSGLAVDEDRLGPTPTHWRNSQFGSPSFPQEIFFLLCASVLGDVFGWATQQEGRIMHDVLPIKGHEHYEIGSNSLQHLSWHTEDAFHPCRGDYVALMCLKNPDLVETVVCTVADIDWSRLDVDALFAPEFTVMPDNSHQPADGAASSGDPAVDKLRARSFNLIKSWNEHPEPRPLLFGDRGDPYMALDPYHMDSRGWSERAQQAFTGLVDTIEANLRPVVLRPGDCLFIDNFRTVHGRKAFQPRYDGSDRWLKRLNITRNLRGSRAWRLAADDLIIY
ncbi:arginine beta-hydroxylase, Fe(II)/alpha-ketoglutarate-dependent [Micromonospora echinospora]|uniref:Arginine beta-hydroxylase, Fe(II)/alpha-ketoglutarate-dependent n=1 Tax=Micromonospora echinospora TaxID=1877 RepID=A0A1C4YSF2_MICEC|nr:arginine beta-hydroxylase, Fe(II)/alpha-ketoglutarate-dependent [Micromonospora echinospora]OZV77382.1 arginine beta-hydroxylase, Fe(II)/alpha-ketoglutarate-dependent [Micromonospora echinospora]SCF23722.1 arginine beta-hydroxylase, Fe(II)/alpha-ketoglutarate-dependent [Micromonospora echinospora]